MLDRLSYGFFSLNRFEVIKASIERKRCCVVAVEITFWIQHYFSLLNSSVNWYKIVVFPFSLSLRQNNDDRSFGGRSRDGVRKKAGIRDGYSALHSRVEVRFLYGVTEGRGQPRNWNQNTRPTGLNLTDITNWITGCARRKWFLKYDYCMYKQDN